MNGCHRHRTIKGTCLRVRPTYCSYIKTISFKNNVYRKKLSFKAKWIFVLKYDYNDPADTPDNPVWMSGGVKK